MAQLKSDNPSFVLHGVEDVKIENRPIPEVENDEVLIEVAKTGICGSDVHYLQHGRIGSFVVKEPMCLGHESSGKVVKLGPKVTGLKVGQRVALEPGMGCRTCDMCKGGLYELCPDMTFAATPPYIYGTLCRYYKLVADMLHPIPDSVSDEDGAMMEPLSVAVHSVSKLAKCKSGDNVVIFGAGPVGLLCMAVAKALGAARVVAVDIQQERLDFAKSYAATDVFLPPKKNEGESTEAYAERAAAELLKELDIPALGSRALNICIDASGAAVCIATGLHLLRPDGTFVQVGMGAPTIPIPMFAIVVKQLRVLGSFRYGQGDYPLAISLVSRGLVDLKPLVTHRYKFADARKAFDLTKAGKDKEGKPVIKVIIDPPQ
ncbi:sorbitol dehydrogenase [Cutaneotrichosporon oleaginosum]|uniref:Sorbitol dehydrogenase n=1 Tax=Cutaneotrichosporon oleaginosum TaxID=879819 RepID=A0A0J0XI82_9TREE|nr:sorbitol dehydrogenase [Cutaneotrichosporon oleaginosum]KLT40788.1 sorbitol dehydrogenase [Cutaneotrichosporon oleaginosum]TXT11900.1 hypothetical protein COLE_02310 [Cutaneotrichosporon oleaginosum]